MKRQSVVSPILFLCCIGLLSAAVAVRAPLAEDINRDFTFNGQELTVSNAIGAVSVRASADDAFHVSVALRGSDAGADKVRLNEGKDGAPSLDIRFPLDEYSNYVYPTLGQGSRTTIQFREHDNQQKSWLRRTFRVMKGKNITVKGDGNGFEVWADVVIEVPAGRSLKLRHGVGEIEAADLKADLNLDSHAGGIAVVGLHGDLRADTGSGNVIVRNVEGNVNVDTGSGRVEISDGNGSEIKVDTGSGGVEASRIRCSALNIDTGSGGVSAAGIDADDARIDTGSGDVELDFDRVGSGKFVVDTGSGGIKLQLPAGVSARIDADTGSGRIVSRIDGTEFEKLDNGGRRLLLGGGDARISLDTGSGSVQVSQK